MLDLNEFKKSMKKQELSENTMKQYLDTISQYLKKHKEITEDNLLAYKGYLVENYKPKTINAKISGINKYLKLSEQYKLQLTKIKLQEQYFIENVISDAEYQFLKTSLKKDKNMKWYFLTWFLGATGARISEALYVKAEDVTKGCYEAIGKGGKRRPIFIPKNLREKLSEWLEETNKASGYVFIATSNNTKISNKILARSSVNSQFRLFAKKYGINPKVCHPHSFRHLYALNFLDKYPDISLLANILGHNDIRTTQIYLKRSFKEVQELLDTIIV